MIPQSKMSQDSSTSRSCSRIAATRHLPSGAAGFGSGYNKSYADESTTAQKSKVIEELKGEKDFGL